MTDNNPLIYIMRHGRTQWNDQGKLQGRLNSPLLPESIENLHRIGKLVSGFGISSVYSSPLERCRQSSDIICEILGLSTVYIDDLAECDHGKCEGLSLDESKNLFPEFFFERESGDKWNVKWPDGESYSDVTERAKNAIKIMDIAKPALIIAHETVNKILTGLLLGYNHKEIMLLKQHNSEIFIIDTKIKQLKILKAYA